MAGVVRDDVIFVHIPKTAGTSIGHWLGGKHIMGHPKLETLLEHPGNDDRFTFTVVRNPWDRALSGWMYLFHKKDRTTIFQEYIDETPVPTFEEFIFSLDKVKTGDTWFTGATPQVEWFRSGVDTVLRFETLERDFRNIKERLGNFKRLPHLNASEHSHYREYYTPETRAYVAEIAEEDIREFEFTF
jgi:chondroitin 4-sulfotransferase 11